MCHSLCYFSFVCTQVGFFIVWKYICAACVHLQALSSFPPWPLSPDFSAWEQRRTMVTRSQRAIAWGGAISVCCQTGLCFNHPVISSECLWASWERLRCLTLPLGHLIKKIKLRKYGVKVRIEIERCNIVASAALSRRAGWEVARNVLFWYSITRKGWEYPGTEIIPRKPFPSGHTFEPNKRKARLQSWWKTD